MTQQLINVATGEFTLDKGFVVSGRTRVNDLVTHFGEQNLTVRDFKNGYSNYSIHNLKLGELYFILTFYFLNDRITKTGFLVQAEPYNPEASWDDFDEQKEIKKGKFIEQWLAKQMQGDYKTYGWGKTGVNYDFHNLSSSGFISYHSGSTNP